jgi:beta-galactosidase
MVLRDRNHPCVFMWSLCNEEYIQGTPEARRLGTALKSLILGLDPTRPVTAAMNGGFEGNGLSKILDVMGFNYNDKQYDPYHRAHRRQPAIATETASAVGTRGVYRPAAGERRVSAYDIGPTPEWGTAEKAWKAVAERPYMSGSFVWTGFDYKGEPTPFRAWPNVHSNFGILDVCGFPKDSYYYYKSWWSGQAVLHLLPHWNWEGMEGRELDVWAHSNCAQVELFLNGKSLGKKAMPRLGHLEWKVAYAPGVLSAKGYTAGGSLMAEDKVETSGPPQGLRLRAMRPELLADGSDAMAVELAVVDAAGRVVPTASNRVTFKAMGAGSLAGVGNGDPTCTEADISDSRSAFNGLCLAVLRAGSKAGRVTLEAVSPGLKPATLTLEARQVSR